MSDKEKPGKKVKSWAVKSGSIIIDASARPTRKDCIDAYLLNTLPEYYKEVKNRIKNDVIKITITEGWEK